MAVAVELSLHLECLYCELVMRCSCPQCFKLLGISQSMHQALDAIPCIVSSRLGSHYSGPNQADRIDVALAKVPLVTLSRPQYCKCAFGQAILYVRYAKIDVHNFRLCVHLYYHFLLPSKFTCRA